MDIDEGTTVVRVLEAGELMLEMQEIIELDEAERRFKVTKRLFRTKLK